MEPNDSNFEIAHDVRLRQSTRIVLAAIRVKL